MVTPLSNYDDLPILALNYFEGTIDKFDQNHLIITIPFNKILPESYNDWFIDNIFEAEYFPLTEAVTNPIGLSNIAIAPGNYPVTSIEGIGYQIIIVFQEQIEE
jgi:hypothetical protein